MYKISFQTKLSSTWLAGILIVPPSFCFFWSTWEYKIKFHTKDFGQKGTKFLPTKISSFTVNKCEINKQWTHHNLFDGHHPIFDVVASSDHHQAEPRRRLLNLDRAYVATETIIPSHSPFDRLCLPCWYCIQISAVCSNVLNMISSSCRVDSLSVFFEWITCWLVITRLLQKMTKKFSAAWKIVLRQDPLIWVFGHFWLFCTIV